MIFDNSTFASALTIAIAFLFSNSERIDYRTNLQLFFGLNSTQSLSTLTIDKTDIPGLTYLINNTAESLLVGLLINAINFSKFSTNTYFYLWGSNLAEGKKIHTVLINLYNLLAIVDYEFTNYSENINPMDY